MINSHTSTIVASWDETIQCVVCEATGFFRDDKIKEGMNNVLELFKQKHSTKLLSDISQVAPFSKAIDNWIEQDWMPRMIEAGLHSLAFVIPKNVVTRMIMEKTDTTSTEDLSMVFFDSQEAAKEWLLSR